MDHAPARGGDSRRPHWWVGIGGRRALLLLRACWWYGQRKRLVQVQAKVVAGPGGGNDMLLLHTYIPTYHYFSHHRPRCCPACAVGIVYVPSSRRAAAESWLTRRRAKANTLPTSRLLPAASEGAARKTLWRYPCPPFGSPIAPPSRTSSSRSSTSTSRASTRSNTRVSESSLPCRSVSSQHTYFVGGRREEAPQSLFEGVSSLEKHARDWD
jgi:hypothetical protein